MANGEAESDIGRDSGRGDFESCQKYRARIKHSVKGEPTSDRDSATNGRLNNRGWSDGHEN